MLLLLLAACTTGHDSKELALYAYMDGIYTCCAEGDGTDCCVGSEVGMCFEYGGLYQECVADGQQMEGKVVCAFCCSGEPAREPMVETTDSYDGYPAGCGPGPEPPSLLVCVSCGDGECGSGENKCVCPEDCSG